jgi:HEAT repeat protein
MRPRYADLFEALCDPDPERADRAFDAILFDRAEALPELLECYQGAKRNARLRYLAIQLMGFTEDKRAIPMVLPALEDPHPLVRAEACRSLEDLNATQHRAALEARLGDMDALVRKAAAEALENIS